VVAGYLGSLGVGEQTVNRSNAAKFLALVIAFLPGCTGLITRMPGYHLIDLAAVRIETVPSRDLFRESTAAPNAPPRTVLRFDVTSNHDLVDFFHDWILQLRCNLEGVPNGRPYSSFGYGALLKENERQKSARSVSAPKTPSNADAAHVYTLYAFVDLKAVDEDSVGWSSHVALETLQFDHISCYLIGVTKAPVLFPKSNAFSVTRQHFIELLQQSRLTEATPNHSVNTDAHRRGFAPWWSPVTLVR